MMMFEGDDALKKVAVLSGGEKSRVLLAKLIATPVNLLLLDEPTNHLDMDSSDALLEALDEFDGAVIMVTHNEMFLDALAERLIVFQEDGITVFEGAYSRFLERVGWSGEREGKKPRPKARTETPAVPSAPNLPPPLPPSRKELRKIRSDLLIERSKVLKPLELRMAELEKAVEDGESEMAKIHESIVEASRTGEGSKIPEMSKRAAPASPLDR